MLKSVTDADFVSHVNVRGVTVAEFGAPWCPPCKTLLPILEELSDEYGEAVTILKIDVDESPSVAAEYGIMSMPTVIAFKDAQPVEKLVGLRPKEVYKNIISRYLS